MKNYKVTVEVTFELECETQVEAEDIVATMLHSEARHNDVEISSLSFKTK